MHNLPAKIAAGQARALVDPDFLASRTPIEIDSQIAPIHAANRQRYERLDHLTDYMHRHLGDKKITGDSWASTPEDATRRLQAAYDTNQLDSWKRSEVHDDLAEAANLRAQLVTAHEQTQHLGAEYDRRPWARYYWVISSDNGRIHADTHCSSYITTQHAWMVGLAGATLAEVFVARGPILCRVCFPAAPPAWTAGLPDLTPAKPKCAGASKDPKPGSVNPRLLRRRGECTVCGDTYAVTATGLVRTHAPKAAAK